MNLIETVRIAFRALRANKLRTALAMLGIVIGVAAVSAIMSIGATFKGTIAAEFSSFGAGTLTVVPGGGRGPGGAGGSGGVSTLKFADEVAVTAAIQPVNSGSFTQVQALVGGRSLPVTGANERFEALRNWKVSEGRMFTRDEHDAGQAVAVIGTTARDLLFGSGAQAIGQTFKLQGREIEVVGLLEESVSSFGGGGPGGGDANNLAILPNPLVVELFDIGGPTSMSFIFLDPEKAAAAKGQIEQVLTERHGGKDFTVQSPDELLSSFGTILDYIALFIGAVASISLLVGGIGIMNIMLVSVKERTREIGIRKAVGARRRDIQLQFLVESAVLSLTGGAVGVLIGLLIGAGASAVIGWTFVPSMSGIGISFAVSAVIGIFFGLYPAWSASRLPAMDALRYE